LSDNVNSRFALAYVGVGSNIHPEENVVRALESLIKTLGVTLTGISTFYRTAALPDPKAATAPLDDDLKDIDPDFLNGVLEVRTVLTPPAFLAVLAGIERALGRHRPSDRFAPRTMDLDLLLYGLEEGPGLSPRWKEIGPGGLLAHPDIGSRSFVAHPLLELAPNLILPNHGTLLRAHAASFDTPGGKPETAFTEGLRSRLLTS
jgi:2-amino-4-hydroxy-6-hydroxymethyldihydropteridine diphosphokinase